MNDFRFALRQFWKNPGFTLVAILTLALGIGANTAIFSIIDAVLLKPLPFPDADRIVTLWERSPKRGMEQEMVTPPNFVQWRRDNTVFEEIGFWTAFDANLATRDGVQRVRRAHVSSAVFSILRVAPLMGRGFLPEEDEPDGNTSAVISYELWQNRFGGRADILGQSLTVDTYGRRDYSIVGVMPARFEFPERTELWLAAGWNGIPRQRQGHWFNAIARLKPGVPLERARAEMNTLQSRLAEASPGALLGTEVSMVPLLEQTLGPRLRPGLILLWSVVTGVLLIACANVANLLLARAVSRRKEMGLRAALGASRRRIIRQLLIESSLLALAGGVVGALLGWWALQLFLGLAPADIPRLREIHFDLRTLLFTFTVSTVTGILFGLAPAWNFSRPDLERVLREGSQGASAGLAMNRVRKGLVVAEMAVSLLLLVGAALMIDTFLRMLREDRGFQSEHVITAQLDFSVSGFTTWVQPTSTRPQIKLHELLERLRGAPGVKVVAAANTLPRTRGGPPRQPIAVEGRDVTSGQEVLTADYTAISPDYFNALGAPLLKGRNFTEQDRLESAPVLIVNETLAKQYFPGKNPIGKRLAMGGRTNPNRPEEGDISRWPEIVGVVADIKTLSISPESHPQVYVPYWQYPMQTPVLIARAIGDPEQLSAMLRREVKQTIPTMPEPTIRTMDAILSDVVAQPRFQTWLLSLFGLLAITLAAIGLYGTLAYAVAQRTHEIGIRMALGAERRRVLGLIMKEGMRLVLAGAAIGCLLALASSRVLSRLFYQVHSVATLPLVAVLALLFLVALIACWLPARRASKVNPMEALRCE